MKKRAKLFTTIASLCMAVALMAFGVYAATSATLNVKSQVSFTVTDVDVKFTVSQTLDGEELITGAREFTSLEEYAQVKTYANPFVDKEFNNKKGSTMVYTITCENLGNS